MHVLDKPGHALRRIRGEAAEAEHVGERESGGLGGHGLVLRVGGDGLRGMSLILGGRLGTRPAAHSPRPARPATRVSAIQPK